LDGDGPGSPDREFVETECGNEEHGPPGEANHSGGSSHHQTEACADYYWDGNDWQWDGGYWLDQPWPEAIWIPGHWSDRWWGYTWVPGYWF
jgi:hypothetical protein